MMVAKDLVCRRLIEFILKGDNMSYSAGNADVAVIGAGAAGLACSRFYLTAGAKLDWRNPYQRSCFYHRIPDIQEILQA